MAVVTAADVRRRTGSVDWDELGYPEPDPELQPPVADPLDEVVLDATAYVATVTGRYWDGTPIPTLGSGAFPVIVTAGEEFLYAQAVRMRTVQVAFQEQGDYSESATDDVVGSFSAGSYSETRADPNRRGESKAVNSWPALESLLWLLMTDDQRDYWRYLAGGVNAPATLTTETDWSGRNVGIGPYVDWPGGYSGIGYHGDWLGIG
jgi:hypothetical protein